MNTIRWGILGCGDVTEIKSGPALQKAEGSALVAAMRRDRAKAEDFARRHGVPRAYGDADALIHDADVDAVYIATPPSSNAELALRVAAAGKPCLGEKPMATSHAECQQMVEALVQHIVDELRGQGTCESTGESGARSSWVMEQCLAGYYESKT